MTDMWWDTVMASIRNMPQFYPHYTCERCYMAKCPDLVCGECRIYLELD